MVSVTAEAIYELPHARPVRSSSKAAPHITAIIATAFMTLSILAPSTELVSVRSSSCRALFISDAVNAGLGSDKSPDSLTSRETFCSR